MAGRNMYKVVLVTCSNTAEGEKIAQSLLKKRLAACVSIIPRVTSLYWWRDKIERASEVLLIAKTSSKLVDSVIREVRREHSYENPEIIALDISKGSKDYLKWIADTVGGA